MGFKKESQFLSLAAGFATLTVSFYRRAVEEHGVYTWPFGLMTILMSIATLICLDIWRLKPADSHSFYTLYTQYTTQLYWRITKQYYLRELKRYTADPKKVNEDCLMWILKLNKDSAYGKDFSLGEIRSREEFVEKHPLTTYEHYKLYIDRVLEGEENVMFPNRPLFIARTSGTTSRPKYLPLSKNYQAPALFINFGLPQARFVHLYNLKRHTRFYCFSPVEMINGSPCGVISMAWTQIAPHNNTPSVYAGIYQENASFYVQALFSLAEPELQYISGFSSDLMLNYMKLIVQYKDSLCEDIEKGTITCNFAIPDVIRAELTHKLTADPRRADQVRCEIEKGSEGLMKRLWPDLEFVMLSQSGSFKMSYSILAKSYLKGLKTMAATHGASESMYGVNYSSEPGDGDLFTMVQHPCLHELIPIANVEEDQPKTIFPDQAKVGEQYEVVTTTINGLYRYRSGDIIRVVGHTNQTPKYEFLYRLGSRLSIYIERTPENIICSIMTKLSEKLPYPLRLRNYVGTENVALYQLPDSYNPNSDYQGHYVFFVAIEGDQRVDTDKFKEDIDVALKQEYEMYADFRVKERIGAPSVYQSSLAAFDEVKDIVNRNNHHNQFKFPHITRNARCLEALVKGKI